jgi:4'-phosphopantetheinyl transferase
MFWKASNPIQGTVDLYYADMDDRDLDPALLMGFLSSAELARAERFRFDLHRRRFIVGRCALRSLLSDLQDCDPSELTLRSSSAGKPVLSGGPAFNVSHSDQHLLIGVAGEGSVGVDVETKKPLAGSMEMARSQFSAEEIAALDAQSPEDLSAAFLRVWTRKESLLKAWGGGLSVPMDQVSVRVDAGQGNQLQSSRIKSIDPLEWCVQSIELSDELEVAVAWDQPSFMCRFF